MTLRRVTTTALLGMLGIVAIGGHTDAAATHQATQQAAQQATPLAHGFNEVNGWILKAADLVPADKYGYKPVDTVRTVGQQFAHVADAYAYFCGSAKAGKNVEWTDSVEKAGGGKAAIVAKLKAASDSCAAAYASGSNAPPLMANIAHANLHYGNLVTYMRMLGLTPPSS